MKNHNETIKNKIRKELEKGYIITVLSVLKSCKTMELRSYVAALKKSGMKIRSEWVKKNGKHFKQYFLAK